MGDDAPEVEPSEEDRAEARRLLAEHDPRVWDLRGDADEEPR